MFVIVTKITNVNYLDINYSIVFLILEVQIIMLFYYQNNKNSILKFKENLKTTILVGIFLTITLLIFIFIIKMNIINISIALGYNILMLGIIEFVKKSKK